MIPLLLLLVSADPSGAPADARSATLRAQARAALGGEAALSIVRALSLEGKFRRQPPPEAGSAAGTTRAPRGPFGREAEGELTMEVALPDKLRREESFAVGSGPSVTMIVGLDGDHAWMGTDGAAFPGRFGGRGGAGGPGGPGGTESMSPEDRKAMEEQRRAAMGRRMQAELQRILLALLADPGEGASIAYGGQAESPDGRADILEVTSASGAKTRVFLDAATHLPLMLTYQETMPGRRLRPPPAAAPDASPSDAAPRTVESTLFLSDHRAVGGMQLPHHVSRAVNGNVVEEWSVTRWRVNPSLKPERFARQ
jgi:hypothetical protein